MRTCILRALLWLFADAVLSFFGVTFVSFCFAFLLSLKPWPLVELFLKCMRSGSHSQLSSNCLCHVLFCFFFVSWEVSLFSKFFVPLPFHFCMESTLHVFLPDGVFLPCNHELDLDISVCKRKYNQSIKGRRQTGTRLEWRRPNRSRAAGCD